jgi:hypothetical protein
MTAEVVIQLPGSCLKVSLEAVNKPFYGLSQYMCNSVEVVKNM